MTVAVWLLLLLSLGFAGTALSRGNLVLLLLLPASEFLGFVDPMRIAVKGVFDLHALFAVILLIAVASSARRYVDILPGAKFKWHMAIFFLFWCYGVLYPWSKGYSSLFYSLKSSKEFMTIFGYFAVLLFLKNRNEVALGWMYLCAFGLYYSFVEILGQFTGPSLSGILSYDMRPEEPIFTKIYVTFWPVILFALLYYFYSISRNVAKPYVRAFITLLGLMLTFFRSYLLATIVSVPLVLVLAGQGLGKSVYRILVLGVILSASFLAVSFTVGSGFGSVGHFSEKFVGSAITELATHSGGALLARERVAKVRERFLMRNPLTGYGFLDKDSALGRRVPWTIKGDSIGFIDRGILDIPAKFGYAGCGAFLVTVFHMVVRLIFMARKFDDEWFKVRCMTVATILMISIAVLPVHAPLTYSFFLLPLGIALGLIEKERHLLDREERATC